MMTVLWLLVAVEAVPRVVEFEAVCLEFGFGVHSAYTCDDERTNGLP